MRKMNHANRLPAYTKVAIGSVATASAMGTTDAAVIYFDVNPDQTFQISQTLNFGSINLGTGTYTLNGTGGTTFGLYFAGYSGGLSGYLNPLGNIEWGFTGSYVERLALNDGISGGSSWSWSAISPAPFPYGPASAYLFGGYAAGTAGNWGFGPNQTQTGFAPLRIDAGGGDYNYGWVEVSVQSGNTFSPPYLGTVDVTVTGFAFEDQVNTPIEAGAVPEPSTYALLALAGLFGAAVWHHRRHQRGASPALLQLAAGARGVEKFRADKAA